MSYKIDEIEGIGPAYSEKLGAAEVKTTDDLLKKCCDPKGRKALSEETGMSEKVLLDWTNKADLMRITASVRSSPSCSRRPAWTRSRSCATATPRTSPPRWTRSTRRRSWRAPRPSATTITKWVEEAKGLDPIIKY